MHLPLPSFRMLYSCLKQQGIAYVSYHGNSSDSHYYIKRKSVRTVLFSLIKDVYLHILVCIESGLEVMNTQAFLTLGVGRREGEE